MLGGQPAHREQLVPGGGLVPQESNLCMGKGLLFAQAINGTGQHLHRPSFAQPTGLHLHSLQPSIFTAHSLSFT